MLCSASIAPLHRLWHLVVHCRSSEIFTVGQAKSFDGNKSLMQSDHALAGNVEDCATSFGALAVHVMQAVWHGQVCFGGKLLPNATIALCQSIGAT